MPKVRVITPITASDFRQEGDFASLERAGLQVSHTFIAAGPSSIESRHEEALAVPNTIAEVQRAEEEGVNAVVIDCMGDPAVEAARETVRIPVIGPAAIAYKMATMLGDRFGVISVLNRLGPLIRRGVHEHGYADRYAGLRAVDIPVLQLHRLPRAELYESLSHCAEALVREEDADVIIFGCTGMNGCARVVEDHLASVGLHVPVLDPTPLAVRVAAALADAGLSHSARCYPRPKA